jgi:hypothetical protein
MGGKKGAKYTIHNGEGEGKHKGVNGEEVGHARGIYEYVVSSQETVYMAC